MKIYFTNDIHSNFQNLIRLSSFIKDNKHPGDLLLDAGDLMDLKDLLVQGNLSGICELMRYLGYDCMAIGNNECDQEYTGLSLIASQMKMLSCNLFQNDLSEIPNILKSTIITKNNIRFLIIGVSPYYNANLTYSGYNVFYNMGNLNVVEPICAIEQELEQNQGRYDISILLSHSGLAAEEHILSQVDGIDICIGGHSHSKVERPRKIKNTIYMQACNYAEFIGVLDLEIEKSAIKHWDGQLIENTFAPDERLEAIYRHELEKAKCELSKPVTTIKELHYDPYHESELINFISDSLFEEYPCDFAFIHAGICNSSLSGDVSMMKLIELSPSKLNPTRFKVKGSDFKKAIQLSLDHEYISQSGMGPGFRGSILGCICVSHNVSVIKSPLTIYINGELLDDSREYDIISDDYMQRADYYPSLHRPDSEAEFYNGFIRDLIYRHITNTARIESSKIKRFH